MFITFPTDVKLETSNLVNRLSIASPSLAKTNHPERGEAKGQVMHFKFWGALITSLEWFEQAIRFCNTGRLPNVISHGMINYLLMGMVKT